MTATTLHPATDPSLRFPPGFVFGTATAAYQIEGAVSEDGRGPSVWDTFNHTPGAIGDGSTGDVACDSYHRYAEDARLSAGLGAHGYRFSVSWSRVQPTGSGPVNPAGLDYYSRLVDALLEQGVTPVATLFHWDLPQALDDEGGWINRGVVERFAEYAATLGERYADRVEHWVPINEPNVVTILGYAIGMHAPGRALMFEALPVAHHLLLAHGRASIALRESVRGRIPSIGCANNHAPMWPATDDEADVGATKLFDGLWNGLFMEPMLLGRYPEDCLPLVEDAIVEGDMTTIRQPLDFYGVNYYNPMRIGATEADSELPFEFRPIVGYPVTDFGWPVVPDALREWLVTTRARFRAALPPLMVTESGCSYNMGPDENGVVDDQPRIDYLESHLNAVAKAIQRGVDVRGYYCWSLMDNFEWAEGYTQRFGLVHIDFETQKRTPKRSFDWYRQFIAAQAERVD
jgi:beta-glucosidase